MATFVFIVLNTERQERSQKDRLRVESVSSPAAGESGGNELVTTTTTTTTKRTLTTTREATVKAGDKESRMGRAVKSAPSAARATILEDRIVGLLERIVPDVRKKHI